MAAVSNHKMQNDFIPYKLTDDFLHFWFDTVGEMCLFGGAAVHTDLCCTLFRDNLMRSNTHSTLFLCSFVALESVEAFNEELIYSH